MRNYFINLFYISGIMLLLSSCESMLSDVDVPESDPKLVVTGYISPQDDTISILVKKSRPLYVPTQGWDYTYPPVNNATVTLSSNNNSITIPFNPQTGNYQILSTDMPIIAGNNYSLQVTTPEGYNITSDCTVPADSAPEIEITGIDYINDYNPWIKKISLRFRDLPGSGHLYRIAAGIYQGDGIDYIPYFYNLDFDRGEPFVSDKNKEGEYFSFRTMEIYESEANDNILYISLLITDENYYNYHRSINSFSGDNPFAEPTPVFSNIRGGLGVFAAVNGRIMQYDLNQ